MATTSGRTRSGAHPRAPGLSVQSSAASVLQAQDLDGQDINAAVEVPPATRSSKKAAAPKTNEFDDDEVEDLLSRLTGVEADRPQSSGSAGRGSGSRATAEVRADPSLPREVVRIGNKDAPAPEQRPDR